MAGHGRHRPAGRRPVVGVLHGSGRGQQCAQRTGPPGGRSSAPRFPVTLNLPDRLRRPRIPDDHHQGQLSLPGPGPDPRRWLPVTGTRPAPLPRLPRPPRPPRPRPRPARPRPCPRALPPPPRHRPLCQVVRRRASPAGSRPRPVSPDGPASGQPGPGAGHRQAGIRAGPSIRTAGPGGRDPMVRTALEVSPRPVGMVPMVDLEPGGGGSGLNITPRGSRR